MTKNALGIMTATALAASILVPVAALESKAGAQTKPVAGRNIQLRN